MRDLRHAHHRADSAGEDAGTARSNEDAAEHSAWHIVRNPDGSPKRDLQPRSALDRIMKRAGLPLDLDNSAWHKLRHTFGTHAALCGVNPWSLMTWMGHKTITEILRYVHVAGALRRPLLPGMIAAAGSETDPDRRVLLMLGARGKSVANGRRSEGGDGVKAREVQWMFGDPDGI